MPKPKRSLTWGQILEGAERLDARHGTERYGRAVITAMLARVVEQARARSAPRAIFSAKLFGKPRPPVLSPLQQRMAERRRKAYEV
jgi:hypothetical protein